MVLGELYMLHPTKPFLFSYLFRCIVFCLLNNFATILSCSLLCHIFPIYLEVFYDQQYQWLQRGQQKHLGYIYFLQNFHKFDLIIEGQHDQ